MRPPRHLSVPSSSAPDLADQVIAATISVVGSNGYEAATTGQIAQAAGTTVAELSRLFHDKDGCCLRAFDAVCEQLDCLLLPIYLRPDPWEERISAAALTAARYCGAHEDRVSFAIEERFRRGRTPLGEASLGLHLRQVDMIRYEVAEPEEIPDAAAEIVVGSFLEALLNCHSRGRLADFERMLPDLLFNALRLYRGVDAAEVALASLKPEILR
jgi:AcrR family transcriptional regulator